VIFILRTNLARYRRVQVFRVLEFSTRVFSLPLGQLVLYLVWPDSSDSELSNSDWATFVTLGLGGRQGGEGTRFGLL
jgi:hypothetical protein